MFHFDTSKQRKIFLLIIFNFEDICDKNKTVTCLLDIPKAIPSPTNFGITTEQKN